MGHLVSEVTYHEVEVSRTTPHEVDHPEGSSILPIGCEYIGHGGKDSGGYMFKFIVVGAPRAAENDESEVS